ncbi:LysR family transcriptional regulator [Paraburkholderia caballeronis]|uniref:DNA-binding transcriptional regulator, LysR family n=1 Tax=Paraburkholderia caballeronis TaxID=416943 RepID=A0A1H7H098_9BURK|nr:LysR family transcriptional regulator [Paraburkholderia caballeronis]PXW29696.1 LysR family transcriptional regulator [Paraburkholderia caballeronis]PXX04955.1 LysR family transcriptional regulator [Paraburkholderia caballeronis]RAK06016.1 LysR family transcriptional regulator [Paraburkholderia caballeronis]TDV11038.1 LysR family transcriptional regulator [Paraburkholderia caballeronis]TDV14272.1 LysR family transcriptional regulator [Paraburkholderia caballeronis]
MDLTLLRAFVTVAHEGNLTRAAAQLHLTQPAVSLQIKHLHETLGVTLFTRTSHGLVLTRDGQALLPHAERALAAATDVQRAAATLRHEVRGRLRIGTILDPAFLRLGGFLRQMVETWPQIETALRHGMSGWVLEQVRARELDVGYYIGQPALDGTRDGAAFHTLTLTQFQYRVLAPAGWKDRVKGARDWKSLAALPWIWTPPASAHNRLLSHEFEAANVKPVKVAEVDQEPSMLDLVKSGVGLTLARDATAIAEAHAHALTIVEGVTVPTELTFVTLAARQDEPTIAAALKAIDLQWAI